MLLSLTQIQGRGLQAKIWVQVSSEYKWETRFLVDALVNIKLFSVIHHTQ